MVSIGIDIGSVCAKAVAFDGEIAGRLLMPTGWNPKETGRELYRRLLADSGLKEENIASVVATGYGRVSVPFATRKVTEITCHARGASFLHPETRTVIDVGGQDSKVIAIDEKGNVLEFMMNDKCAAGTGRFLQVMANVLETEVDQLERLASGSAPRDINSMCAVFAESEVISLLSQGSSKEAVASGILHSISNKITHLTSRITLKDQVLFTGGVSHNGLIREILSKKLKHRIETHRDSQFAGAIGAAIIGFKPE
ncbi:MAG TPA: acyl-CoA dehydratase activase [Clostridia bacterium]|nr:acyl-CoA dehydratase activase [Clostridia bacterium]